MPLSSWLIANASPSTAALRHYVVGPLFAKADYGPVDCMCAISFKTYIARCVWTYLDRMRLDSV